MFGLTLSLLITTCCVFQLSHSVIKPLRVFNTRMNEILQEDNYNDVSMNSEDSKCREIKDLQEKFSDLIADYKFSQNEFMK